MNRQGIAPASRRRVPRRGSLATQLIVACVVGTVLATAGVADSPAAFASTSVPAPSGPSGAPTTGSGLAPTPPGAVGSIVIGLYNPGSSSTGPYDQPVAINSSEFPQWINSNWTNGVAAYTSNNTPVYGWIESGASNLSRDTLLWLRLASLPAHAWTNVSIWFWPKTSFNLSKDGFMGENPLLSPRYAAFDNGARVFDEYANFSGSALPAGWTTLGNWAGSVGRGVTVAASSQVGAIETALPAPAASDLTVEADSMMTGPGGPVNLFMSGVAGFSSTYQFYPSAYALEPGAEGSSAAALASSDPNGVARLNVPIATAPADFSQGYHVVGLEWRATNSTEVGSVDYLPFVSQVNRSNGPMNEVGLGAYCNVNCTSWNVSWVRARNAPDPMPEVLSGGFDPVGVAAVSAPTATDPSLSVLFTCRASSSLASPTYSWSFGDGQSGSGKFATHSYSKSGTYVATCLASGASGAAGGASVPVVVNPNLAILYFQALPTSTISLGSTLTLIINITGGTAPFGYSFTGLPPGCPSSSTSTLTCLPGETGTFAIKITVTDAVGETTFDSITVSVTNPPPPAGSGLTPAEGYALAGAVAGAIVLAGVLPVLLWTRRSPPGGPSAASDRSGSRSNGTEPGRPGFPPPEE